MKEQILDDVDRLIIELDEMTLEMCENNNRPTMVYSQFKTILSRLNDFKKNNAWQRGYFI